MSRPRIVIVGAGFAGYRTARTLARAARGRADITLLNPTDYFLYLPLLPQVAAGILEPRRVTVSLSGTLPGVRLVLGEAGRIDLDGRTVHYTDPEDRPGTLGYDRLVLAAGSVNKLLPIPGVAEHAHGFRGLPEALYLRDHVTRQVELAATADNAGECAARCTFVVVGAGYTGTEVAAQGQLFTDALVRSHPLRKGMRPRWLLLDIAPRVLPELDQRLSRTADQVLRERGVDVRMGTSVKEATGDGVLLTDGEFVDTRTLVWCVGVRPDPLAESLGLPMERGRLLVEPTLQVPGRPEVFACGDAAAVPDLEKPGQYTPMTAQHAWRQGKVAGHNIAASLTGGELRPYRHKDMGFVVDLGGVKAAANPLGVPLSGLPAGAVTRGYHLAAMPGNRVRVAADWLLDAVLPRQAVQLGLVRSWSVPLDTASPELARVPNGRERQRETAASGPGAAVADDIGDEDGQSAVGGGGGEDTSRTITSPTPDPVKREPARRRRDQGSADTADGSAVESAVGGGGGEDTSRTITSPTPDPVKSEPAKSRPGSEPAKNQPGSVPGRNQPGSVPGRNQPGPEPGRNDSTSPEGDH
ncbi:FAD-dependent oxidoreductase [Streptomyces aurantiogriseus]|uniref:Dehydrogenase n=1 Tax=Streptomyces aurantiogriseus TaxID=66870 RepID=A0A918F2V5_9ACTN|nr:FAD-dependent oxidoreductase [Streptomyces aurantiogriseus]GGQ96084.1 dehydrogenase [Streptomyces aurantiogriseus]